MNNIDRRIKALEAKQERGTGWPVESLDEVMTRLQTVDGYDLSGMPGDTLTAKMQAVDQAHQGVIQVSPEIRHAARCVFAMYEVL